MKNHFLMVFLTFLTGCALLVPKGEQYKEENAPQAKPDKALIYFYRVGNQFASEAGIVDVFVNDMKIFGVINKGYTWFYLNPGDYLFKAKWQFFEKPMFEGGLYDEKMFSVNLKQNEIYYLNYRVNEVGPSTYDMFGLVGKMAEPRSNKASVEIVQESLPLAVTNLQKCRFQENLIKNQ